jgi:hypothetical protein
MSNIKLSLTAIATALGLAIALQSGTAMAQSVSQAIPADALKGTQFADADYIRHSWGLEHVPFDAPPVQYTWSEVNARLNAATVKTGSAAPRADLQPIPANALRGTQFDGPEYVRHDWGLEYVPFDAPSVRLNWGEIKRRLG